MRDQILSVPLRQTVLFDSQPLSLRALCQKQIRNTNSVQDKKVALLLKVRCGKKETLREIHPAVRRGNMITWGTV